MSLYATFFEPCEPRRGAEMQTRPLGNSDLEITPIGFGSWAIGGPGWAFAWGPQEDGGSIAAIREALDLGINWIDTAAVYGLRHNVFVAGDLLWYPIEGDNRTRSAPDAMVVFGRPKGYRGSYMQWVEDGIAPQVVFEVLSPGNRFGEMARKFTFYEQHGVDEY
jgi:Putative restriction endonuclease/Aldo/keto reductase family